MTDSRSRVVDFLAGGSVDRPPVVPLVGRLAAAVNQIPDELFLTNATQLTTSLRKAHRLFGYDGVVNCLDPTIVSEALGATVRWHPESGGFRMETAVSAPADIENPKAAPERGRLPIMVDAVGRLTGELADDAAVFGLLPGPFVTIAHLAGDDAAHPAEFVDEVAIALNELTRAYGHADVDVLLVLERAPATTGLDIDPDDAVAREGKVLETLANIANFYDVPLTLCPQGFAGADLAAVLDGPAVSGAFVQRSQLSPTITETDVRIGTGIPTQFGDASPEAVESDVAAFLSERDIDVFPASGGEVDLDTHPEQLHAAMAAATEWRK